jgi:hypothetical protein
MKNIKNKIYKALGMTALLGIMSLQSCLNLDPQDQIGGKNMWENANEFKEFANNFYGWTRDFGSNDNGPHSDSRSDLITFQTPNEYSRGSNTIPSNDGNYTNNYSHIRRCNLLLQAANSYSNQSEIKEYVGDAYFFRAYSYFELLQCFGDAIIVTDPIDVSSEQLQAKRDSRQDVAKFIVSDLEKAIELLPNYADIPTSEDGHVSKEAAEAFLSRVALYEGTWEKFHNGDATLANTMLDTSAKAAKKVMDGGQFYLFGTRDQSKVLGDSAYKYMFILENEKSNPAGIQKSANHEYIFRRLHDTNLSTVGMNITHGYVNNVMWVTRNFANLYLCSDGLPIEKSKKFEGYQKRNSEFQNRDNRMKYSLLVPGQYFWTNDNPRTTWVWKTDIKPGGGNGIIYNVGHGSGYNNQKWGTERAMQDAQEGYDYPVIRYAEVLLNYAEAVYERDGKISDADLDISLNLVRLRANPNMPKLSNSFVSANGLNMEEEIRRERTVELYLEGFRLDDLKRWGTAVQVMNQPLLGVKYVGTEFESNWGSNTRPSQEKDSEGCLIMDGTRQWTEKNYLYPIPSTQLELDPNLGQNPGWN